MKKSTLTQDKAKNSPAGGVVVGERDGQTMIYDDASVGGYFVGKTHKEGGIQMINKSNGQPLEVQGSEVIITAPAVADNTKREFEGKMMTNREILSAINEKGGGVAFANGGDVPKSIKHIGASYKYGGKTMTDHEIMMKINGGHLAESYSLREIANIHQVPLSELKEQVRMGMKAESEHTSSKREQMKIVKDHLFENPKYYSLLKKAGLKHGGTVRRGSLVRDAKSGNTPARDLNNYNDVLDLDADGVVGAETGLYANGGMMANDVQMVSTKYLNSIRSQGESNWDYDLEKSIEINGLKEPIIIGYWEEFGKVSLLDGHHRLDASMSLGINKIPTIIVNRYDYPYGKVKLYDSPILKINPKKPSDLNIFKNGGELSNLKIGTLLVDNDNLEYHEKLYRILKIDDKQFEISVFEYQKEKDSFILPIKMLKDFKLANQEEIEFYNNSKDNYDNNEYADGGDLKPYDANMEGDSATIIIEEEIIIEELNQEDISEAIETLEILYSTATKKEKQDIIEAIEGLKMLSQTN